MGITISSNKKGKTLDSWIFKTVSRTKDSSATQAVFQQQLNWITDTKVAVTDFIGSSLWGFCVEFLVEVFVCLFWLGLWWWFFVGFVVLWFVFLRYYEEQEKVCKFTG